MATRAGKSETRNPFRGQTREFQPASGPRGTGPRRSGRGVAADPGRQGSVSRRARAVLRSRDQRGPGQKSVPRFRCAAHAPGVRHLEHRLPRRRRAQTRAGPRGLAAAIIPRLHRRELLARAGEPTAGGRETHRRGGPQLRRQMGDVRVLFLREIRGGGMERSRHRLRRAALECELLGTVVSGARSEVHAQAGLAHSGKPAHGRLQNDAGDGPGFARSPRAHGSTSANASSASRCSLLSSWWITVGSVSPASW